VAVSRPNLHTPIAGAYYGGDGHLYLHFDVGFAAPVYLDAYLAVPWLQPQNDGDYAAVSYEGWTDNSVTLNLSRWASFTAPRYPACG